MFTLFKKLKAGPRRRRSTRRHLPRVYGLRQVAAQTINCGVRRPYRRKVQQITEPRTPGARNDSATPATAAAEKRHTVA